MQCLVNCQIYTLPQTYPALYPRPLLQGGPPWAYLSLLWPSASIFDALLPSLILAPAVRLAPSSLRHMSDDFAIVGGVRALAYCMSYTLSTTAGSEDSHPASHCGTLEQHRAVKSLLAATLGSEN